MFSYILKRVALMIVTMWFVITITFTAMYLIPGDPYNSEKLSPADIYQKDEINGFNRPYIVQYLDYFSNILGMEGAFRTPGEVSADEADIIGDILAESGSLNTSEASSKIVTTLDKREMTEKEKAAKLEEYYEMEKSSLTTKLEEYKENKEAITTEKYKQIEKVLLDIQQNPNKEEVENSLLDEYEGMTEKEKAATLKALNKMETSLLTTAQYFDKTQVENSLTKEQKEEEIKKALMDSGIADSEVEAVYDNIMTNYLNHTFFGFYFGESFTTHQKVGDILISAYPISFTIGISSVIIGVVIGVFLGILSAIKKNTVWDYIATIIAVIGVSFPSFVIASYLQYYFAVELNIFPSLFNQSDLISYVLPIMSLAVFAIAQVARVTRTEMLEVLNSNYINLAKAKGVSSKKIIFSHAFRNTLVAVITIVGPIMVSLTTGSLVIEKIFGIKGIGDKLVPAVLSNDIFVVLGTTILIAFQILVTYLVVDILYVFIDPRIAIGGKKNE